VGTFSVDTHSKRTLCFINERRFDYCPGSILRYCCFKPKWRRSSLTSSMPAETTTLPWVKIVHYGVFGLLAIGAIAYVLLRPPFLDPMSDPEAAEAMALVQTHRAQQSPTIRQAISERVKVLSDKGRGV